MLRKVSANIVEEYERRYGEMRVKQAGRTEALARFKDLMQKYFETRADESRGNRELYREIEVKFEVKEFGSAMFGGDDEESDLDLLLISYNDLLNRD